MPLPVEGGLAEAAASAVAGVVGWTTESGDADGDGEAGDAAADDSAGGVVSRVPVIIVVSALLTPAPAPTPTPTPTRGGSGMAHLTASNTPTPPTTMPRGKSSSARGLIPLLPAFVLPPRAS